FTLSSHDHPDHHSFPTRRSSDLRGQEFQIGHGVLMARGERAKDLDGALRDVAESWRLIRAHIDEVFFGDIRGSGAMTPQRRATRSEEHTSELQSRGQLVCRLLLE